MRKSWGGFLLKNIGNLTLKSFKFKRQCQISLLFQGDITDFKGYYCDACGKRYCNQSVLRAHKKSVHMPEDLKKPFKCEYCAKSFVRIAGA